MNTDNEGNVIICGGGGGGGLSSCISTSVPTPGGYWKTHSFMTSERSLHSSVTAGGKLHIIAGRRSATAETFDEGVWRQRGPLPYSIWESSCAVKINERSVFVTGGYGADDVVMTKSAMWDPELDQWTPTADMDIGRSDHGCGVIRSQGKTYVLVAGGRDSSSYMRSSCLYDVSANSWTAAGNMNQVRVGGQMLNGNHMAGGWNSPDNDLDTIEKFDIVYKHWSMVNAKMRIGRSNFASVAVNRTTFCRG